MSDADVLVVGAGVGGSAVARRLAAGRGGRILLLESGGSGPARLVRDGDARVVRGGRRGGYPRGVGLGGGGAVNGGVVAWGYPDDHDAWAATTGETRWSWASARRRYAELTTGCGPVPVARVGPAGRLLTNAACSHGAVAVADLSRATPGGDQVGPLAVRHATTRRSSVPDGVDLHADATVARVVSRDGRVVGVELADGEVVSAPIVVLAAGTLGTLPLLRDLGVETCDVTEHPGMVITIPAEVASDDSDVSVGARLSSPGRVDDVSIVAMNRTAQPGRAAFVVSVVAPESRGCLEDDHVEAYALDAPADARALAWGIEVLRPAYAELDDVRIGRIGELLSQVDTSSVEWLRENLDGVWHLGGGARIGRVAGPTGAIEEVPGLWVADASALPGTPRSTPQTTIELLAGIVADAISDG